MQVKGQGEFRVGLIGTGNQCRVNWPVFKTIPGLLWRGIYDLQPESAKSFSVETSLEVFEKLEDLMQAVDIVYIATPTETHFPLAQMAIMAGKHVVLEKPATENIEQLHFLMNMAAEANVQCTVCYPGRFNPAWTSVRHEVKSPLFIETHHLRVFNQQEIPSHVVADLMQNDLDVILPLVNSEIKRISATAVRVAHDAYDMANVRLEFANGCVANLTASRISMKPLWKMRIFERNAYHYLDFITRKADLVTLNNNDSAELDQIQGQSRRIHINDETHLRIETKNAEFTTPLFALWIDFLDAIRNDKQPRVSLQHVYKVMETSDRIIKKINSFSED